MKTYFKKHHGLTLVEVLVIVVVLFILAFFIWPAHIGGKRKPSRIICVNNLKQVGLSFRIWAGDHGGQYPMQAFTNQSGVIELNDTFATFEYFQLLTNELGTPKALFCLDDKRRPPVLNFSDLNKSNSSYFIGLEAHETFPQTMLSGDRNITNGFLPKRGILELTTNHPAGFTEKIHVKQGNIAIGDGSVLQVSSARLRSEIIQHSGFATNRMLLP